MLLRLVNISEDNNIVFFPFPSSMYLLKYRFVIQFCFPRHYDIEKRSKTKLGIQDWVNMLIV